jgi:hypothetical protein
MLWVRLRLSDGSFARLAETVSEAQAPTLVRDVVVRRVAPQGVVGAEPDQVGSWLMPKA